MTKLFGDTSGHKVIATDNVSFDLRASEVLGIVGESGSGKTTLARMIMRLVDPTFGRILLNGEDFAALRGPALKAARRNIQMVFQDPYSSLNPRHKIGEVIAEPLRVHGLGDSAWIDARVLALLEMVGLPADSVSRYPHEFSGGQRQRIAIARAIAVEPKLIVADEPVSSLDVSIQSQILKLIAELRARLGLSMIFISHDLRRRASGVRPHRCDEGRRRRRDRLRRRRFRSPSTCLYARSTGLDPEAPRRCMSRYKYLILLYNYCF